MKKHIFLKILFCLHKKCILRLFPTVFIFFLMDFDHKALSGYCMYNCTLYNYMLYTVYYTLYSS